MADISNISIGIILLALLWVLPWKGYALWLAARQERKWWFIILLVVNTLAILEIVFIFFVAKRRQNIESETK
jgi:uncharacterized membrane protein